MSDETKPPFWRAMAGLAIDAVLVFGVAIGISALIYRGGPVGGGAGAVVIGVIGLYYLVLSRWLGGTIGDRLLRLKRRKA